MNFSNSSAINFIRRSTKINTSRMSIFFWSIAKRQIILSHSSIHALVTSNGVVVKDKKSMCNVASRYYSELFGVPDTIVRPHPYMDAPVADFIHIDEKIPTASLQELRESLIRRKLKRSEDAHGISPFMLESVHESHWKFLLFLYNR
jgi:hypothetical protein